ncbi:putative HTH-type transcriptional regulator YbbH [Sporomusa carbonis]|uniref:MurR/RpiR family transcriptional regulator n=1 Tax=Sporomusa carbonis TaxID=3076075 RepID=UPI003A70908C
MSESSLPNLCLPLLRSSYQSFTKSERRVASFIIEHPHDIIHMTISDLAEATKTAEATISRFCRKLGFNGLQSLKIVLASEIFNPLESTCQEVNPTDSLETMGAKIFNSISEGLQDTLKLLDFTALQKAIDILNTARKLDIYAFGISSVIASDIEHRFIRFGIPTKSYSDLHMQLISASLLEPEDVVIAVSHTGSNTDLLQSVETSKKSNAKVIAITSHLRSPLAQKADIVLHGMSREIHYRSEAMASRLVHMAIVDLLYVGMIFKKQENFANNLNKMRVAVANRKI